MTAEVVSGSSRVTLFFSLQLEDGAIVDSNFDKDPATFDMGDGSMLPAYEKVLLGLSLGEKSAFVIKASDGFGEHNPDNIQGFPRRHFDADMTLEPGLMVSFADAAGNELAGVVQTIADDAVLVDFNHPLAGRDIEFKVNIVAIEAAAPVAESEVPWSVVRGLDNAD
jgi:FKBP-type peptidyl-prolyl cis-trans isomerase SlpA